LIEVSKQLEAHARHAGESAVVLAAFQEARFFTADTRRRYEDLARHAAFVGALGEGMSWEPCPGVRGAILGTGDPLRGEWDIAVLGLTSPPPWSPATSETAAPTPPGDSSSCSPMTAS